MQALWLTGLVMVVGCSTRVGGAAREDAPLDSEVLGDGSLETTVVDVNLEADADSAKGETTAPFTDLAVSLGEPAFNESMSSGFREDIVVEWESFDVRIESTGRFRGTFALTNRGPVVTALERRDALFITVRAAWVDFPTSASTVETLLRPNGAAATKSDDSTATFTVDVAFPVPIPTVNERGWPLASIAVGMTWVRHYRQTDGAYFHVFPGRGGIVKPVSHLKWDAIENGRDYLGYYAPIAASKAGGADGYDYRSWFPSW